MATAMSTWCRRRGVCLAALLTIRGRTRFWAGRQTAKASSSAHRATALFPSLTAFSPWLSGHGFPTELQLPSGEEASFSPDGTQLAYVPHPQWEPGWKHYRGGQTTPIWLVNLATSRLETAIPRDNSNDSNPMWVGDTVYFLSDRNGPVTLFSYDTKTKQVAQLVDNKTFDLKSASAGPGGIV